MSAKGNRGFADLIAGEGARTQAGRLPPRTGILSGRENRLSELASGHAVTRVHELVDPARCRIWAAHNRDYDGLTEVTCSDLIESMKAQGRQEVPAIVRRVKDDAEYDFEVVCGARRHWTVCWLRAHDYPDFRFLVEPRELSDEEAFRISDLENRSRKDLSDYERASDYARALERYYDGSQQRMAERLNVTKSWLSRYLELARLPEVVIKAFGSPHVIGISHAARLAPLLRHPISRKRVEAIALDIGMEQASRLAQGRPLLVPAKVLTYFGERKAPDVQLPQRAVVISEEGRVVVRGEKNAAGIVSLSISAHEKSLTEVVLGTVARILAQLS